MKKAALFLSIILVALATTPSAIVTIAVGPINLIYSILLSVAAFLIIYRLGKMVSLIVSILFSVLQYFTPVPFWMCVNAGYTLCSPFFEENFRRAIFNAGDLLIIVMFLVGYILFYYAVRIGEPRLR